ncbi:MAG: hypothetical protein N2652_05460 [Kiritimatiellae bacterium]|nr:hypothetical protein [Kiritimatiellia bacterium]
MPRQIRYEDDLPSSARSLRHALAGVRSFLFFGSIVFGILYLSLLILARTEGIRAHVADALSARLGARVAVGAAALWPPATLVLRNVATTGDTSRAGVQVHADRVAIRWGWPRRGEPAVRRIDIAGGSVLWRADVTGAVATGDWARLEQTLALAFGARPPAPDALLPVVLHWQAKRFEAVGTEPGSAFTADTAEVRWTPLEVNGRRIVHLRASARMLHGAGAASPGPWDIEAILAGERRLDLRPAAAPAR